MIQATAQKMTLEQYLAYNDGTEQLCELENGVLVPMPTENDINAQIASFLFLLFFHCGIPGQRLRLNTTEIAVSHSRATCRKPDLMILTDAAAAALAGRKGVITRDMPAPMLVVEVVSPGAPGEPNYDRDYIDKRREYAERGIAEYWLVDPSRNLVMILHLDGVDYKSGEFREGDRIISPTFPALDLTAAQLLRAES